MKASDLSPQNADETMAAYPTCPACAWPGEPLDTPQSASGNSAPVDSIAFADMKLRDLLHAADHWMHQAIERRGLAENVRRDVAKLRLARLRVAELLLLVPPSAL